MKNFIEEHQYVEELKCKLEHAKQEKEKLVRILVLVGAVAVVALIVKLISDFMCDSDCCGDCDCDDDYEYEYEDEDEDGYVYEDDFE